MAGVGLTGCPAGAGEQTRVGLFDAILPQTAAVTAADGNTTPMPAAPVKFKHHRQRNYVVDGVEPGSHRYFHAYSILVYACSTLVLRDMRLRQLSDAGYGSG